jgi:hypothetical protein
VTLQDVNLLLASGISGKESAKMYDEVEAE